MKKDNLPLDLFFKPLLILGIVLVLGIMLFPEFVQKKPNNQKIKIEIQDDEKIKNHSNTSAETKKSKTSTLDFSNLKLSEDKTLVFLKVMGVDPSIVKIQEEFSSTKNEHNQIDKIQIDYKNFKNHFRFDKHKPLKEYMTKDVSFWFTDYLFEEQIRPLMEQLDKWQEENDRPVQMQWQFEYTSENGKYPIYMNLQVYSPQTKEDIDIPLNINITLYNKLKEGNIDYVDNIKTSEETIETTKMEENINE